MRPKLCCIRSHITLSIPYWGDPSNAAKKSLVVRHVLAVQAKPIVQMPWAKGAANCGKTHHECRYLLAGPKPPSISQVVNRHKL